MARWDGSHVIDHLTSAVDPVDTNAAAAARDRHARLAKPPRSLGRLEDLGVRLAAIGGRCPPRVPERPVVLIAAGDHGVHARGISDWPQAVTSAMVATVAGGRAAVNAIANTVGADVALVDVGTAGAPVSGARDGRVRAGTRDLVAEPAMTEEECLAAVAAGAELARERLAAGADLLATGDLGIGNTTASACLVAAFTGAPPADVTGRGANRDDARTPHKISVVEQALARHDDPSPLGTLASLGGFEHAALVGVMLVGAVARVPVVLDGLIAGAAALATVALCPAAAGYLIAGHASAEPGAAVALAALQMDPLLDLDLRLGEGTGAVLAVPVVQAAARVLSDMATLDEVVQADPAGLS